MKKLICFVSATVALLFASVTLAQEETTTVQIPAEGKLCFEVVRGATADPNPANHAECGKVSDPTLAKINALTASLNKLRGRVVVLEQRVDEVEKTANQADKKADLAISGVLKVSSQVTRLGQVVEQRVSEVEQGQTALVTNMDLVAANDAKQDKRLDKLEARADKTDQEIADLKTSGNKLTLSASWLLLGGTNSKYAAPLVSPGLSLGLGPKSSLNIDLGLTANKSGGKTSLGTAVKVGLAYSLDVVTISAGWATYALGLDRTSDAMAIKSGIELGIMKEFGSARIFLNVMPGGVDYAVGLAPGYALGANAGVGYAF